MLLEIIVHLIIGGLSWLIASRFLKHKTINVLLAVIIGQLIYACVHYPVAAESARILQQRLTFSHYLFLVPFRTVISFLAAFTLFKLNVIRGKEFTKNPASVPLFSIETVRRLFICKSVFFSRLGISAAGIFALIIAPLTNEFSAAMRKLDKGIFSRNYSSSLKMDYFWGGLFDLLLITVVPSVLAYLFVTHVLYRAFFWLKAGYKNDLNNNDLNNS